VPSDQRIAFVTCEQLPYIHQDDDLVADLLRQRGMTVTAEVWTSPSVDWARFAAVVIRSPWDYHLDAGRYEAWLHDCAASGVRVWNPAAAVLANLDKRYLAGFASAGVEVVPFDYVDRGESRSLRHLLEERGWARAVVKPAVSASAFGTWRTSLDESAEHEDRFAQDAAERSLLVQPFVDEIVTKGEWSIVFFDGEYSHAVLKQPASGDFRVQEELGGRAVARAPSARLIEDARRVLSQVPGPLLYARVDGIGRDGRFVLMELEINEPFLYIGSSSGAAERFAGAIARAVARGN
jgi:glutathione synthase/RimK-type ligase-like ATP-grasp enzyme